MSDNVLQLCLFSGFFVVSLPNGVFTKVRNGALGVVKY